MADYNQVICVDEWELDATYDGVYPKGAREKDVYFSPERPFLPFIKPNHRYLLKKSFARYPWQFWMEVIACRIGEIMDVKVPPAYAGMRHCEENGKPEYGALIEWFYSEPDDVYTDGGRIMARAIIDFDVKHGSQHNLWTILNLGRFQDSREYVLRHWADVFIFDTLIGNTDRHQDNWGVVIRRTTEKNEDGVLVPYLFWWFSPAFDNGTALNHEIIEENFFKFSDEKYLNNYLTRPSKARHHMKWSLEKPEPMNFYQFMRRYVTEFLFVKERILSHLDFSQSDLEERLSALPALVDDPSCRLTEARLAFTIRLIMKRRELLLKEPNA